MKNIRKLFSVIATVPFAITLVFGFPETAEAYIHNYSTMSPYTSGSNVYFGSYATNKNSSGTVDFDYGGRLFNNLNGNFINSVSDREQNVGANVQVTLRGSFNYNDLSDHVRCENNVRAYTTYSQYNTPYETFVENTYYNK